jgi:hypothetical protein
MMESLKGKDDDDVVRPQLTHGKGLTVLFKVIRCVVFLFLPFVGALLVVALGLLLKRESRPQEALVDRTGPISGYHHEEVEEEEEEEEEKDEDCIGGKVVGHWVMVQSPSSLPFFSFSSFGCWMEEKRNSWQVKVKAGRLDLLRPFFS